jgi:hypothetical protein
MRLLVTPTSAYTPPPLTPSRAFITRTFDGSGSGGVYGKGLGQASTVQTAEAIAATGAQLTVSILVGLSVVTGPIGAVIGGIIAIGFAVASMFKGCGATCTQASNYANQVESQLLKPNLTNYLSSPIRTVSMQQAAVNNYNTAIAALEQACGQAQLGKAGVNCIDERVNASSCQWKASPGGWVTNPDGTCTYNPWGASGSGSSCWNWVIGYLDPITQDPCVQPDSVLLTGSAGTASNAPSTSSITDSLGGGSVLSSLQSDVTLGSMSIPLWVLLAAGVAALAVLD